MSTLPACYPYPSSRFVRHPILSSFINHRSSSNPKRMALSLSLKPSRHPPAAAATPSRHPAAQANSHCAQFMPPRFSQASPRGPKLNATRRSRFLSFIRKAVEESQGSAESEAKGAEGSASESGGGNGELSEVGAEIKKAMMERKRREEEEGVGGGGLLNGVAEEIGEIEWPAFGKVLGTTGVVLGVIAGSSVVLLTVNAVLAELSDRVFAGKGVQDFFS